MKFIGKQTESSLNFWDDSIFKKRERSLVYKQHPKFPNTYQQEAAYENYASLQHGTPKIWPQHMTCKGELPENSGSHEGNDWESHLKKQSWE